MSFEEAAPLSAGNGGGTRSGGVLTHTVVKQGGEVAFADTRVVRGGITINDGVGAGAVVLDNVTFADNGQADVFFGCGDEPTMTATNGTIVNDC